MNNEDFLADGFSSFSDDDDIEERSSTQYVEKLNKSDLDDEGVELSSLVNVSGQSLT